MLTALSKLSGVSRKSLFEAIFTIGGRMLSVFIFIASTKFLTTFLSEADYGKLALYNITAILPSTFFFGPIAQGVLRFFPIAKEQNNLNVFRSHLQYLYSRGGLFTLLIGISFALICWTTGEEHWALACLIITALNIVNAFNTICYSLQNIARKRALALGLETGDRLLQQSIAIMMLLFVFHNPLAIVLGYLIASVIFLFINWHYYLNAFPKVENTMSHPVKINYSKSILHYSWPFIVIGVFYWIQSASERWALGFFQSTETIGQFAVLSQLGFQSMGILFSSINYFLYPILFNRAGSLKTSSQFKSANKINDYYLFFIVIISFFTFMFFICFSKSIICLLTDEKYSSVAPLLPMIAIAGGSFHFGQYFANRFMLTMQSRLLILPKILTAIIGLGLNIVGSFYFGLTGLVYALIVTYSIYIILLILYWKTKGNHTPG